MFPLNWNIPFIRKNGSRTTLGAITGDIAGIEEDVADLTEKTGSLFDNMMETGAVNLMPQNYSTATVGEVEYVVNSDKTITATITATTTQRRAFTLLNSTSLSGRYMFTGCPSGGTGGSTYAIEVYNNTDNTRVGFEVGNGLICDFVLGKQYTITIQIWSGQTAKTLVFKPMLSDPSLNLSYDDYVPYAKTNRELTEELSAILPILIDSDTINANSSKAISITDSSSALYRLTLSSIGSDRVGKIVIFGKHPSVANIKYSTFDCDDISSSYAATISVSGSSLTITSATNSNCMYTLEQIKV